MKLIAVISLAAATAGSVAACRRTTEPTHESPAQTQPAEPTKESPAQPPPTEPPRDASAQPSPQAARTFDFDADAVDQLPAGFTEDLVGGGPPVRWRVVAAADAPSGGNVVAQLSADRTDRRYPHLVRDDFEARDVDVAMSFRAMSGEVDASGGIVFRYQDRNNFYVVRANALEGNVVAYKTVEGKRSNIGVRGKDNAYGVKATVPNHRWNTLRVIARGSVFEIFLNGQKLFEAEDTTFADAGKIGLWTKADAVTQFDDLRVLSLDP